jgi:hypothetical protein
VGREEGSFSKLKISNNHFRETAAQDGQRGLFVLFTAGKKVAANVDYSDFSAEFAAGMSETKLKYTYVAYIYCDVQNIYKYVIGYM